MSKNTKRPTLCIIPNYVAVGKEQENKWLLTNLIKSFVRHESDIDLLVVDDGSRGVTKSYYYQFSYLTKNSTIRYGFEMLDRNLGFASAVNHGLMRAKVGAYKYAVLVNNDAELVMPFADRMDELFLAIPKLAVWGPRLLYPDGRIQSAGFDFDSLGNCTHYDRENIAAVNPGNSQKTRFVQGVTGAFMGIRIDGALPFSEDYKMAYEDVDYCLTNWKHGKFVIFDGAVDALHYEGATRGIGMSPTELDSINTFKQRLPYFVIPRTKMLIASANKQLLGDN